MSFDCTWRNQLERLAGRGLARQLRPLTSPASSRVARGGASLLNLASNNYLGLADDPRVIAAAKDALDHWGVGAGASRLVSGDLEVHHALERELADLKQAEAALLYPSGFAANLGLLTAIASPRDTIFADALNHASLNDGCRLSGARVRRYSHGDVEELEQLLRETPARGQRLIVTDSVFSMDGELAPLPALAELARRYEALLVVDDAHGTGVVGEQGRGALAHFGLAHDDIVQVATLSKALGVQGGAVAGSRALIELLVHRSRPFVYSTGLAPALAEAARAALAIARDEAWRRERQQHHLQTLRVGLAAKGYRVQHEPPAPMLLVMIGHPEQALQLAARLESHDVLAPAIRPPTVPDGTSRVRLAPMATHSDDDIAQAIDAFPAAAELQR